MDALTQWSLNRDVVIVLMSRRQKGGDWAIRNDLFRATNEPEFLAQWQEAERQRDAWIAVEPETEFEVRLMPRNEHYAFTRRYV